jgi:hypothetical protein
VAVAVSSEASLSNAGAVTLLNSAVIGKVLTGYVSGSGTVAATDTILQAVNKLNGNDALKAPLASPTFTGTVTVGSTAGLGTATGHLIYGPVLAAVSSTTNQLSMSGQDRAFIGNNVYRDSAAAAKRSLVNSAGYTYIQIDRSSTSTDSVFSFVTNADTQTNGAAGTSVTTNEKTIGSVTLAGAWTLGPVGGTYTTNPVVIGSSTTNSGSQALIIMSSTAASRNSIEWYSASTLKGRIGSDNPGNNLITNSSAGDFCIISNSQNILFSGDNGTIHGKMTSVGAWTFGSATSGGDINHTFQASGHAGLVLKAVDNTKTADFGFYHGATAKYELILQAGASPTLDFVYSPAVTMYGRISSTGVWTLGPADGSGGVQFPNSGLSGYTASTLNVYEAATGSFSVAPSAGSGSATVSYAATRIGNIVTLTVEAFDITLSGAVGYLIGSTAMSSRFRPGAAVQFPIWTKENGTDLSNPSLMYIYSSGRIDIYKTGTAGTTFANGVAGCTARASVSYTVS